jgi:hypothetical protein
MDVLGVLGLTRLWKLCIARSISPIPPQPMLALRRPLYIGHVVRTNPPPPDPTRARRMRHCKGVADEAP